MRPIIDKCLASADSRPSLGIATADEVFVLVFDVWLYFNVNSTDCLSGIAGEFSAEYNGPRDSDGIVKYMKSQVGPASRLFESRAKLEEALNKAKDVIVLGVFEKDDKSSLQTQFLKTADKLRDSVNFGHVFTESVSDVFDLKSLSEVETKTAPTIVLVRAQALKNKFEPSVVQYSSGDLEDFIKENYHGIVGHRTQNNNQDFRVSEHSWVSHSQVWSSPH